MTESKTDLFGEVVVTWEDVRLWLTVVPRIDPDGPRAVSYICNWNVPAKIRAAKLAGWFDQLAPAKPPDHPRLRWTLHDFTTAEFQRPSLRVTASQAGRLLAWSTHTP